MNGYCIRTMSRVGELCHIEDRFVLCAQHDEWAVTQAKRIAIRDARRGNPWAKRVRAYASHFRHEAVVARRH